MQLFSLPLVHDGWEIHREKLIQSAHIDASDFDRDDAICQAFVNVVPLVMDNEGEQHQQPDPPQKCPTVPYSSG